MPFVLPESAVPAGTVKELVEDVLTEGAFDATEGQALRWLSRRQRKMCARTRNYRKKVVLGLTAKGQQDYPVPLDVVEIYEVRVGETVYGSARHPDLGQSYWWLWEGTATRDDDEGGAAKLALSPVPETGGQQVVVFAACLPPDLDLANDSTVKIPGDFYDALVAGAIATALSRVEGRDDLAARQEQLYDEGCKELLAQTNRRFRGAGPGFIRVMAPRARGVLV